MPSPLEMVAGFKPKFSIVLLTACLHIAAMLAKDRQGVGFRLAKTGTLGRAGKSLQ